MATWLIIVLLVALYTVGFIVFYAADGWFGWTDDMAYSDEKNTFLFLWPLTMWWAIAKGIRSHVEEAKVSHDKRVAELARIRIQTEREIADSMKSLEEEIEQQSPKRSSRKSSRK